MSYATSGIGSQQHMAAAWFAKIAGIKLEHVPYRGGGQAINDLIAGQCKIGSLGSSPLIPHYKAGTLRLLAQIDGGALAEPAGGADLSGGRRQGARASSSGSACSCRPARRPRSSTRLNREIEQGARASPRSRDTFLESAQEPVGGSAAQFAQLVKDDYDKYARLTRDLAISAK